MLDTLKVSVLRAETSRGAQKIQARAVNNSREVGALCIFSQSKTAGQDGRLVAVAPHRLGALEVGDPQGWQQGLESMGV